MESEFFGYKKGSFTGAQGDKPGLFQAAERGTLFLDEVAELPILMQVKLLRAIQEKQVRPVGSPKEIPVDVRILSATHRNLAELVKQGKFRQDLFYRLNVIEVYVPPLRERPEDIPLLADKILSDLSKEMIMEDSSYQQPGLSEKAKMALRGYYFSGNVRELENLLERAMTLCEDNLIRAENLQLSPNSPYWSPLVLKERGSSKLDPFLDVVEKETILNALDQMQGNKTKAAKLLGISFGALRYRLQKLKLEPKEKEKEKE
jgi:two-component system response regulator PilR (NtrC family)